MRIALAAALFAIAACGDDGGRAAVDAAVDGAPPSPTCDGDAGVAGDDTATTPGAATAPSPTIRNLTLEWAITGDSDLDATVTVRVRAAGGEWQQGAPLRRIPAGAAEGFSWGNRFAGSVF